MSQLANSLYALAVIVIAFLGILLTAALTSLLLPRVRNRLINEALGSLVAAATEKKREAEMQAHLRQKRMERIREAQASLNQWIMGKATRRQNQDWPVTAEVTPAMAELEAEVPQLRAHLEKVSRHFDAHQGFDAVYAQRELIRPLLDVTSTLLTTQPSRK